ncbi:hypothetical protein EDD17DRAFT_1507308 [Pisolithus thermaeus]|nr:hypothetical protein EDD17DRAFT_1507308 [Pisolithus thermaeus]
MRFTLLTLFVAPFVTAVVGAAVGSNNVGLDGLEKRQTNCGAAGGTCTLFASQLLASSWTLRVIALELGRLLCYVLVKEKGQWLKCRSMTCLKQPLPVLPQADDPHSGGFSRRAQYRLRARLDALAKPWYMMIACPLAWALVLLV